MGTITVTGTGGIIEGNLGTSDVNVNLDPVYGNFNATTSSSLSNDNDFDDMWAGNGGLISAWIYPKSDGEGDYGRIAQKGWEFNLREESSGFVKVQFYHGFSTTAGNWKTTNAAVALNAWNHLALFYDSDATGNDPVIYVNGVSQAITETSTPAGTRTDDAAQTLYIGNNNTGARTFDGYIMDIKIYKNTAWTQAEVAVLASKINVDKEHPGLPAPGPRLYLWWKGNASTGTDSSGSGNNLTASNLGSVVYDAFSVDVYDNSTTTDGTFTVTQGKIEGKALSCATFDGTNDYLDANDVDAGTSNLSWAGWFKFNSSNHGGAAGMLMCKGDTGSNRVWSIFYSPGNGVRLGLSDSGGSFNDEVTSSGAISDTNWHHFVATYEPSTAIKMYVDGVLEGTNSSGISSSLRDTNDDVRMGAASDNGDDFTGRLRDMRIYDQTLSADQVASLYSGSNPVTPKHWWKCDEGGTSTAADSGTGTTMNATCNGNAALGDNNGTLDLDGTFTLLANGTLSAPRGNLDIEATDFDTTGTFTHNNGKVRFVGSGNHITIKPNGRSFYNVDVDKDSGHDVKLREDMIIENVLDLTGDNDYFIIDANGAGGDVTLTMGTTSASGTIESNSADRFRLNPHSSGNCIIQGASNLFPCNVTSNDWKWDYGSGAAPTQLANMNFQVAVITDTGEGNAAKLTLTGDMEFDAFTVSSGDTLDLNGERMECSGEFTNSGTVDNTGNGVALLYAGDFNLDGAYSNDDNLKLILQPSGNVNVDLNDSDLASTAYRMINAGSHTVTQENNWTNNCGHFNVASGTLTLAYATSTNDLTVATGATLNSGGQAITVAGDFTTSGGLLGPSCLNLADNYYAVNSVASQWGSMHDALTI